MAVWALGKRWYYSGTSESCPGDYYLAYRSKAIRWYPSISVPLDRCQDGGAVGTLRMKGAPLIGEKDISKVGDKMRTSSVKIQSDKGKETAKVAPTRIHVTRPRQRTHPLEFCDVWLAQDTEKARFMSKISRQSIERDRPKESTTNTGFISCDSLAMAAAVDDSFITESDHYPVSVELTGTYTRGMMILDTLGLLKKSHKAVIIRKVDMKKFEQMMMDTLK